MKAATHSIKLASDGSTISVPHGTSLYEALTLAGVLLNAPCNGSGRCGKCRVRIEPIPPPETSLPERGHHDRITGEEWAAGWRLACQTDVCGDMTVEALSPSSAHVGTMSKSEVVPLVHMQAMPSAADAQDIPYGVAVDLGTTTLGVYLCDRRMRRVVGSAAIRNPQAVLGSDVISRISAVARHAGNLERLTALVIKSVDAAVRELCQHAALDPAAVGRLVVVGNSTMLHLLHGVDPTPIGRTPFKPLFCEARECSAAALGLGFNPAARVITPPLLDGFIGADVLSAAYAANFMAERPGTLLMDLGTNGELVLRTEQGYLATSCATGPAFEGGNIEFGMQALPGAIERVVVHSDHRVSYRVIRENGGGESPTPVGLCGSGFISAAAAMIRRNILRSDGAFNLQHPNITIDGSGQAVFGVGQIAAAANQRPIVITQKDIRALQLATGAIKAGIEILCTVAGIPAVSEVMVAGAFGNHLDIDDARAVGILPQGAKARTIGNAAGAGAILSLFDPEAPLIFSELTASTTVVHLENESNFQDLFVKSLAFPRSAPKGK